LPRSNRKALGAGRSRWRAATTRRGDPSSRGTDGRPGGVDEIQHDCGDDRIPSATGNEVRSLTLKGTSGGCGSMIPIGVKLGELLVYPMPSITAAPDLSMDESACDRSTRNEDRPQMPCLSPGWLRAHIHHHGVIVAVSNHERLSKKQSRRAEYHRPTASPCLVRRGAISGAEHASRFAFRRNESRSLS
jgi:hypothetical protein